MMSGSNWVLTILLSLLVAAAVGCAAYAVLLALLARQARKRVEASLPTLEDLQGELLQPVVEKKARGGRSEAIEQWVRSRLQASRRGRQFLATYQLAYPESQGLWPIINVSLLAALSFLLLLLFARNLIGALFLIAAALSAAYWWLLRVLAQKRVDQMRLQLPDALTTMSNALRAGATILPAVEQAAKDAEPPLKEELEKVVADVSIGYDLQSALLAVRLRVPLDELDNLSATLLVQQRSGGNLSELLGSTAALLRDSVRLKNELRIQTQEGRQTGIVIGLMPVVVLGLLFVTNRQYLAPLLTTMVGRLVLFLCMAMFLLGLFLIRRIVNVKV